ncbi:MAG: hypothetical protein FJ098_00195 [Deltaproteobacteria bacterium]|nr:hypothetical protein [Deltaproteobacteria bacterium]
MRGLVTGIALALLLAACTGPSWGSNDRSWLRGAPRDAAPGRAFGPVPLSTPYVQARREGDGLLVTNSAIGSGISPLPFLGEAPRRLVWEVRAEILREGMDGGWGLEFGATSDGAYRALVYASGRFCVDRAFGEYPEFIHCVTRQPSLRPGESGNVLGLEVDGPRVTVRVNGDVAVTFEDERLVPGGLALAVAGAGAQVLFRGGELREPPAGSPP